MPKTKWFVIGLCSVFVSFQGVAEAQDDLAQEETPKEIEKDDENVEVPSNDQAADSSEKTSQEESGSDTAAPEQQSSTAAVAAEPEAQKEQSTTLEVATKKEAQKEQNTTLEVAAETEVQKDPEIKEDKDPLEFGDRSSVWGKLYLQYRLRPEFRANKDFDTDSKDSFYKMGQRARIGGGFNYQDWLKAFVQFQDTRALGTENNSISNPSLDGNTDLHQAWAEIGMVDNRLALKLGRQQLVYGDQRLIGHLEWLDQGRVFDAALLKYKYSLGQLDLFESVFTPANDGNLLSGSTHFFGAYSAMHFLEKAILFDLYVLGLMDTDAARKPGNTYPGALVADPTRAEQTAYDRDVAADEANLVSRKEVTIGTRLRYNHKIIKTGLEFAGQFGKANDDADIGKSAVAAHVDVKAVIPVWSKPFVGIEGNFATGDLDSDDDQNNQFNNLFPTNHIYYGSMDLASWSNALNMAVRTGFKPSKHFILNLDYWVLAKATTKDNWYNVTGAKTVSDVPGGDRLLGHELDLTLKFPIVKPLKVVAGASIFIPEYSGVGSDVQTWVFAMMVVNY